MGVAEWEAQLEASKQTFEEQLQSLKQVRPGEHRGSGSSLMIVPPFWRGPIGIHCVCPPLLSMLNLRSLTANVSTWRPSFKHLSRRQRSLGDQIQTSLLVVGVVVVLVVIVVVAAAVAVAAAAGGGVVVVGGGGGWWVVGEGSIACDGIGSCWFLSQRSTFSSLLRQLWWRLEDRSSVVSALHAVATSAFVQAHICTSWAPQEPEVLNTDL